MKFSKLLFVFIYFLIYSNSYAQNWNKKYISSGEDFANSIVEFNNQIIINVTNDASCKLIKTDLSGNILAQTKFNNLFRTSTILVSSDNNLIIVGNDLNNNGVVILKMDFNFNEIWSFRSSYAAYNFAESGIINSNGDITVCGYTSSDPNSTADRNGLIFRVNNSGQVVWTRVLNSSGTDYFSGICEGNNGEMVLTGAFLGGAGLMDLAIYKINSTGDALYLKLYGGGQNDGGYSVDFFNNHFYISGNTWSTGAGEQDILMMKFTNDMNLVWAKNYGGEKVEPGLYITHGQDGNLYLVGQTTSTNGKSRDLCILKLDENGSVLKIKNIGGTGDEAVAFGYKVLLIKGNSYYIVCGSKTNSTDYDALLLHTDLETNDNCCRTVEQLNFVSTNANLNFSNTNFNTNNAINRNSFSIQKTNIGLTVDNLCDINYTIDLQLFFDNTTTCKNSLIQFQAMTSAINLNYQWNFGDPSSGANNTSTDENPSHIYANKGNYLITLIGNDGCVNDTDTVTINIKESDLINTDISNTQKIYCIGENVSLNAITSDPEAVHLWNFDDPISGNANSSTLKNTSHTFTAGGFYRIKLIAMNDCHVDSSEIELRILENTPANFSSIIDSCLGAIQLVNTDVSDVNTFNWIVNNTLISSNKNTNYQLTDEGEYEIKLIKNPNTNCKDSVTKLISFNKIDNSYLLLIPTVFSPNNDGRNDIYSIQGNIHCNLSDMKIMNRWGEIIYSSNSNFNWDGKSQLKDSPEGTYIVYIEYNGRKTIKTFYLQR